MGTLVEYVLNGRSVKHVKEKEKNNIRKWKMMQCSMKVIFFSRSRADFLDEDEESDNSEDNNESGFPENSGT